MGTATATSLNGISVERLKKPYIYIYLILDASICK